MARGIRNRSRPSSLTDRASVRGVKQGPPNRRRRPSFSFLRPSKRGLVRFAKIAAVLSVIAALVVLGVELRKQLLTSPKLAIASIDVRGTNRATTDAVIRLSGVELGQNILSLATDDVARAIEAHPWIARAEVTRRLPSSVDIEVVEHEPVVLVALGHLYYANADGKIVKRYTPGENEVLPVVTGLDREKVEAGDAAEQAWIASAISLAEELKATLGPGAPVISEIHVDPAFGLSFTAQGSETSIVVGQPPWRASLERYREVESALAMKGVRASKIVLGGERRKDRAVARLAGEAPSARR
ncbi:FtsQ-type POTRA domain-containing protein [Myxococcota bacterium]|nr:FtsQ-type POTRA domain-containing protein [Myxococcota bacterium]